MGQRRRSAFDDLMAIASKLPWKVSVSLAFAAFVILHLIAQKTNEIPRTSDLHALGGIVFQQYAHVFATLSQLIIPAGFLIGAMVSFIKRKRPIELIESVRSASGRDVSSLSWQEFESLIAQGFRQRGFQVTERGGAGPDGGVDVALARGHERFLVQCKQWRARQVGVSVVRELYGAMAAERIGGGYVVTSGSFTKDAKEFAAGRNIELIDGIKLPELLRDGQLAIRAIESMPGMPVTAPTAPSCPKCGSPMVLRTAQRGPKAGGSFWGCKQYPKCRAIVARE